MNVLRFLFVAAIAIVVSSCGDNVSKNCAQTDWVGTYTGTIDCDGDSEDVTVTITASGDNDIIIKYATSGAVSLEAEYEALAPDACELDHTASDSGLTLTVDADLDGDSFTLSEIISDGTDTSTCNITATRN